MAICMNCKKPVTTGKVICQDCMEEFVTLSFFIEQLAEDIVLDDRISSCAMCAIGDCHGQFNGLTCRNAVKAWLLAKASEYARTEEKLS